MTPIELFLSPLEFDFMRKALAISLLVAVPCALLSCFMVLKGWSLMGDAMSHAVFPGVVVAYIIGIPVAIGAFCAGLFCALSTGFISENSRVKRDTVMGIVFSGMFALGMILYLSIESDVHLDHILFGDMLGTSIADLTQTGLIAALIALLVLIKWKDLLLHAFDPFQAKAVGINTSLLHYGLLCAIAMTIVATLSAVGIILSIALLIAPGAIALLLTRRFSVTLIVAVLIAMAVCFTGTWLSFFIDSAPAPTIVVLFSLLFIAAFAYSCLRDRMATT